MASGIHSFPKDRFIFTPWEMTTGNEGKPLDIEVELNHLINSMLTWAPTPDPHWRLAPDPRQIAFHQDTGIQSGKGAAYFFFRTRLYVPPPVDPSSIRLLFKHIDDGIAVIVNGEKDKRGDIGLYRSLGSRIHPGWNDVEVILVDGYLEAELNGPRFVGVTQSGEWEATLPTDPPPAQPVSRRSRPPVRPVVSLSYPAPAGLDAHRFVHSNWEMTTPEGETEIALETLPVSARYNPAVLLHYTPPPSRRWHPAPDTRHVGFHDRESDDCHDSARYTFFRTTLVVPPSLDRRSVHLLLGRYNEGQRTFVNGHRVPYALTNGDELQIGKFLRGGPNSIVLILVGDCWNSVLENARFL
jgi:hypothetical protein